MLANGDPSFSQLRQDIHQALRNWYSNRSLESRLESLYITRQTQAANGANVRNAVNGILLDGLADLAIENPRQAQIIQLHYVDHIQVPAIANQINISQPTVNKDQRHAIDRLAEILHEREQAARAAHQRRLTHRLETSSYSALVGVDASLAELYPRLTTAGAPELIVIEGMGGIGKTSLAHALASRAIRENAFADVGWVTARQDNLDLSGGLTTLDKPSLTVEALVRDLATQLTNHDSLVAALSFEKQLHLLEARLYADPHLIVVDNLETLIDIEALLPTLRRLATPTKFLLTARRRYDAEPGLYHFAVPELNAADSLNLVRQEAAERNLTHLLQASDDELHPIYETIGGNPLAIRLVVGQTHVHSLDAILDDLATAQGATVENLYTFIYSRAWDALDEVARRVWVQMPLFVGRNANAEKLVTYTGYDVNQLRVALNTLTNLNLIHPQGPLNDRYYSIHNLTRTFLLEGVVKWQ